MYLATARRGVLKQYGTLDRRVFMYKQFGTSLQTSRVRVTNSLQNRNRRSTTTLFSPLRSLRRVFTRQVRIKRNGRRHLVLLRHEGLIALHGVSNSDKRFRIGGRAIGRTFDVKSALLQAISRRGIHNFFTDSNVNY